MGSLLAVMRAPNHYADSVASARPIDVPEAQDPLLPTNTTHARCSYWTAPSISTHPTSSADNPTADWSAGSALVGAGPALYSQFNVVEPVYATEPYATEP